MQSCGETSLYVVAVVRKKAMRAVRRREVVEEGEEIEGRGEKGGLGRRERERRIGRKEKKE